MTFTSQKYSISWPSAENQIDYGFNIISQNNDKEKQRNVLLLKLTFNPRVLGEALI